MIRGVNVKINKAFQLGQTFVNDKLKQYGLSSGLYYFILELADHEFMTMQELSREVNVDNGYTTRIVSKLMELGYVVKTANPKDSRSSIVSLTDEGKSVSEVVKQVMLDWVKIITRDVNSEDVEIVNAVFDRFYTNAKEYLNVEAHKKK